MGSSVVVLSVGGFHSCAVTNAGAVKCWGANSNGELGDGTTTDSAVPVYVVGFGVAAITRLSDFNRDGYADLVARDTTGRLWLYPGNNAGAVGQRRQVGSEWQGMTYIG